MTPTSVLMDYWDRKFLLQRSLFVRQGSLNRASTVGAKRKRTAMAGVVTALMWQIYRHNAKQAEESPMVHVQQRYRNSCFGYPPLRGHGGDLMLPFSAPY